MVRESSWAARLRAARLMVDRRRGGLLLAGLLVAVSLVLLSLRACAPGQIDMPPFEVRSGGAVWALGDDCHGALGDGPGTDFEECRFNAALAQVVGLDDVVAVRSHRDSVFAVTGGGEVWAWGENGSGQLGDGSSTDRDAPVRVPGLSQVVDLAVGPSGAYAVQADGSVWHWTFDSDDPEPPTQVEGVSGAVSLAVGRHSNIVVGRSRPWGARGFWALRADGTVTGTGLCDDRERSGLATVKGLADVVQVASWTTGGAALVRDGTVWAWHDDCRGEIDGAAPVPGLTGVAQIDEGVAVKKDGTVHVLSTDRDIDSWTSSAVPGLTDVAAVGGQYALRNDGSVWSWGVNLHQPDVPRLIPGLPAARQVTASNGRLFVIEGDETTDRGSLRTGSVHPAGPGTVARWKGSPSLGLEPTSIDNAVSLAGGDGGASYALLDDGTVLAWGENRFGELGNGTKDEPDHPDPVPVEGLHDIVSVVAGDGSAYAVDTNGEVWGWGSSAVVCDGRSHEPRSGGPLRPTRVAGIDGVTAIVVENGEHHALRGDGTVWTWADGCSAPVRVPGTSDMVDIVALSFATAAVRADGTVWVWDSGGQSAPEPEPVSGLSGATVFVGAVDAYGFVATGDGAVWALRPLKEHGFITSVNVARMEGLTDVVRIVGISRGFSGPFLALRDDGSLWTFWQPQWTFLGPDQAFPGPVGSLHYLGAGPLTDQYPPVSDLMAGHEGSYAITHP